MARVDRARQDQEPDNDDDRLEHTASDPAADHVHGQPR